MMNRKLVGAILGLSLCSVTATSAFAHARYQSSDPVDAATLTQPPAAVTIWFTEGIQPQESWIHVLDASGARVDLDDSVVIGDDQSGIMVDLEPGLPQGTYMVSWQNLSEDGDGLTGTLSFDVLSAVAPAMAPSAGPAPSVTIDSATVSGHELQLHVHVEGVTLTQPTGANMSMPGMTMDTSMANMNMSQAAATSSMPEGHLHVYVDGVMLVMATQPDITLTDVPSGSHQVRVELANNLHQEFNPPVAASTTVVIP